MATNTCMSVITFQTAADLTERDFQVVRENFSNTLYSQGKTEAMPNWVEVASEPTVGYRLWVDHAAAQEFLDFAIATAPTYNMTFVSTGIQDL